MKRETTFNVSPSTAQGVCILVMRGDTYPLPPPAGALWAGGLRFRGRGLPPISARSGRGRGRAPDLRGDPLPGWLAVPLCRPGGAGAGCTPVRTGVPTVTLVCPLTPLASP